MTGVRDELRAVLPGWFLAYWGERLNMTIGLEFDCLLQAAVYAVQAPQCGGIAFAPDATVPLGNERGLRRLIDEPAAAYRERLCSVWDTWEKAGREETLLEQLAAIGCSNVIVACNNNGYAVGPAAEWAKYVVLIDLPHPWVVPADLGDAQVAQLLDVCGHWRDGGERFAGVYVRFSGIAYNWHAGTYGGGATWGSATDIEFFV